MFLHAFYAFRDAEEAIEKKMIENEMKTKMRSNHASAMSIR